MWATGAWRAAESSYISGEVIGATGGKQLH